MEQPGNLLNFLVSFLNDRKQKVVNGQHSTSTNVETDIHSLRFNSWAATFLKINDNIYKCISETLVSNLKFFADAISLFSLINEKGWTFQSYFFLKTSPSTTFS